MAPETRFAGHPRESQNLRPPGFVRMAESSGLRARGRELHRDAAGSCAIIQRFRLRYGMLTLSSAQLAARHCRHE